MEIRRFSLSGWLGLSIMVLAELLLHQGSRFVATWFTPIMWTGYIIFVDALVQRIKGVSRLSSNVREIPFMVLISVGVWLLFEAYNLYLNNWLYLGLPSEPLLRDLGYFWSFATIIPGVFVTIDLVQIVLFGANTKPIWVSTSIKSEQLTTSVLLVGFLMVLLPLTFPKELATYLFGSIWFGFILIFEPINQRINATSLLSRLRGRDSRSLIAVLVAGMLCGFIWESWNFQAFNAGGAYWIYTIPDPLQIFGWKYGMMPVLGLLGFPLFAWELVVIYEFIRKILGGDQRFGLRGLTT